MMTLHEELMAVVAALEADGVPYALVGGLAVAVWGAPRATKDIDLLVQPEDVERAKAAVARLGFTLPAAPMEFSDGMVVHRVSKVRDGGLVIVDFLLVDKNVRRYFDAREIRAVEAGRRLSVIGRDGLIAMKVSAGRPQDQADVVKLTELDR
jgi:hypothetical protein